MGDTEVCGSWRVIERFEGLERVVRWCDRTDGPCPFPGAPAADDAADNRRCGALPGKVLRVTYGDDVLERALADLKHYVDLAIADAPFPLLQCESVYVAIDALRACLGDESS